MEAGASAIERIFQVNALELDTEGSVAFAAALCDTSWEELFDVTVGQAPNMFTLVKLVEVADTHLTRIRLVWSRVWPVYGQHLVKAGMHSHPAVAAAAVDALCRFAGALLERSAVSQGSFQAEALRPLAELAAAQPPPEVMLLLLSGLQQLLQTHQHGERDREHSTSSARRPVSVWE
jgi:hypothetical protein